MKIFISGLQYFCCLCLLAFAAVQYNDPDGLLWGVVYGLGALICLYSNLCPAANKPLVFILWAFAISCLLASALRFLSIGNTAGLELQNPGIMGSLSVEVIREAAGLFILALILGLHAALARHGDDH